MFDPSHENSLPRLTSVFIGVYVFLIESHKDEMHCVRVLVFIIDDDKRNKKE
jgi:hypothetical protein